MKQIIHTAINWLSRAELIDILESPCGMACYDDESTDELRDAVRDIAESSDELGNEVKQIIETGR